MGKYEYIVNGGLSDRAFASMVFGDDTISAIENAMSGLDFAMELSVSCTIERSHCRNKITVTMK